ncbi:MAG: methylmalonyl-CoA mutase family protein [Prevotellaceae bacterium]|jgi:methylmalonyl-CoA mutase|nr:methylmalonyl-CoA mutase family protein [Prevotellaceae bacterium]
MADSKEKLFPEFPPVSTRQWLDKATADLKGADFEKKLVWKTNEGFKVQPFYRMEDLEELKTVGTVPGCFPFLRGNKKDNNEWLVRQDICVECPKEANAKALDILNKGVDSLGFCIQAADLSADYLHTLLEGICAECVELNFHTCQKQVVELANLLTAYFTQKGYNLKKLTGSIGFDPMEKMLAKGKEKVDLTATAQALIEATAALPRYRVLGVDALALNNAGAYIYQELGYALAWGNEYMRRLTESGVPASKVAKNIKFNLGISPNYFLEIAKFRAARLLWANIVDAYHPECDCADGSCNCGCACNCGDDCQCGEDCKCDDDCQCGDDCKCGEACTCGCQEGKGCRCAARMLIHAETSSFNLTLYDAYVNLLRTQTEAMSAALGGIDSMSVSAFDEVYNQPNEFSERLARNQQLLLKEESHFDKVVDAAAGSYYIETLTASIAQEAWKLFLSVEEAGGFYAAIKAGSVQAAVGESNQARHTAVAQRREILLGTNQYPNFSEITAEKKPLACGCGCQSQTGDADFPTLSFNRAAAGFEALRLQTEASGKRPKAFMLTIGNLAMRQARAQFACNFLACAGYEVVDNLGFDTVEAGVKAAMDAKADIVVLCSSDDEYATYALPAFKAVDGKALFIVAGAPACMDELKAAGIENFTHVRVNVLETLKEYNAKLLK